MQEQQQQINAPHWLTFICANLRTFYLLCIPASREEAKQWVWLVHWEWSFEWVNKQFVRIMSQPVSGVWELEACLLSARHRLASKPNAIVPCQSQRLSNLSFQLHCLLCRPTKRSQTMIEMLSIEDSSIDTEWNLGSISGKLLLCFNNTAKSITQDRWPNGKLAFCCRSKRNKWQRCWNRSTMRARTSS